MVEKEQYDLKVYCYFPKNRLREQMIVTEETWIEKAEDVWTLDWDTDDYVYRWFYSRDEEVTVTMGYYQRVDEQEEE